jgi:hypothetical protein
MAFSRCLSPIRDWVERVRNPETPRRAERLNQDFFAFALWKDADPEIPILKEAKAEYARLQ